LNLQVNPLAPGFSICIVIQKKAHQMTSSNFNQEAQKLMLDISSQIEEQDIDFGADIEYSNEVLKIEINGKIFVINKQSPLEEIWLASPLSGPYHFKLQEEKWLDKKANELKTILSSEISSLLNTKIQIK